MQVSLPAMGMIMELLFVISALGFIWALSIYLAMTTPFPFNVLEVILAIVFSLGIIVMTKEMRR